MTHAEDPDLIPSTHMLHNLPVTVSRGSHTSFCLLWAPACTWSGPHIRTQNKKINLKKRWGEPKSVCSQPIYPVLSFSPTIIVKNEEESSCTQIRKKALILIKKEPFWYSFIYSHGCFMYVCVSWLCPMPVKARWECWIPLDLEFIYNYGPSCGCWGSNPGPLEKWPVFLTTEHPSSLLLFVCLSVCFFFFFFERSHCVALSDLGLSL